MLGEDILLFSQYLKRKEAYEMMVDNILCKRNNLLGIA